MASQTKDAFSGEGHSAAQARLLPFAFREARPSQDDGLFEASGRVGLAKAIGDICDFREVTILWHTADGEAIPVGSRNAGATLDPGSEFEVARQLSLAHLANPSDRRAAARLNRYGHLAVMALHCSDQMFTISGVPCAGPDQARCRRELERCLPIVRACLRMWLLSKKAVTLAADLRSALNHCDIPIAIIDREMTLRFANGRCRELISRQDQILLTGNRLSCAKLAHTLSLQASIAHIMDRRTERAYDPILTLDRLHRRSLIVAVARAEGEPMERSAAQSALLYFFDPEMNLKDVVEPICTIYRLTHQESELALALVDGMNLREASDSLGIKEQTARSYLKQVFAKTETNRQTQLVKVLLSSAIRTMSKRPFRIFG